MPGPSVRDVMTFGYDTFPNAPKQWPCVLISTKILIQDFHHIVDWLEHNGIDRTDWYRNGTEFHFTFSKDAILFRIRWT
jgi:hypothetical protein